MIDNDIDVRNDANKIFEVLVKKYDFNTIEGRNKVSNIIFILVTSNMAYQIKQSQFKCYADQFRAGLLDFIEEFSKSTDQAGIKYE